MSKTKVLSTYVPRHLRLGVSCSVPSVPSFVDVVEEIPVTDGRGSSVFRSNSIKSVPADDAFAAYKLSMFKLSAMVQNGVPLNVVNVNNSQSYTIDQLERICKYLDGADRFVQRVVQQQEEKKSWFAPVEVENDRSVSE